MYQLLTLNYVEDDDEMFRCAASLMRRMAPEHCRQHMLHEHGGKRRMHLCTWMKEATEQVFIWDIVQLVR